MANPTQWICNFKKIKKETDLVFDEVRFFFEVN